MPLELPTPPARDGLPCSEVGSWAEDKYKLLWLYDTLFSTGIKNKWDCRVYIDLFSGPGIAQIRGTGKLMYSSPMLALSVQDKFDKYIFCETNGKYLEALRTRINLHFPDVDVSYIHGNCNNKVEEICNLIPRNNRVLSFCFADPFNLKLKFSTIKRISQYRVDFLILLALHMDANRNERIYTNPRSTRIDEFLGLRDWRKRRSNQMNIEFPRFLAEEYARQMKRLNYLEVPFHRMKQVRSGNRRLYRLALFSRNNLAYKFWSDVLKYGSDQIQLF